MSSDLSFQQEQNVSGWMDEDLVLYGVSSSKELPAQLKQMKEELEQLKKVRKRWRCWCCWTCSDVSSVCSRSCFFIVVLIALTWPRTLLLWQETGGAGAKRKSGGEPKAPQEKKTKPEVRQFKNLRVG